MAGFDKTKELLTSVSSDICGAGGSVSTKIHFVQSDNEGFGIFAKEPLLSGETLITVPYDLCITVDKIRNHVGLKNVLDENAGLLDYPDEVLAIGLMHAKLFPSDACSWNHHVQTLPTEFNTTIYWSNEELEELKGNSVYHLTLMMRRQIDGDFNSIHGPLADAYPEVLGGATKELYTWALSVVYSRSLEITRKGKHTRCIVPVLDMANHNPHTGAVSYDTFRYNDDSDSISLVAPSDLNTGDECYAVYGIYPNSKLIYNYGFVVLNNPHRSIDMWVRLPPSSPGFETKNAFLQSNPLTRNQTYDFKGTIRPGYVSPALLATIRVIQAEEGELPLLQRAVQGRMLSVRNEAAAYVSLRNFITNRMDVERAQVCLTINMTINIFIYNYLLYVACNPVLLNIVGGCY